MKDFNLYRYSEIALVVVDVQNDFCPDGSLAVEEGDMVVSALNKVMDAMKQPDISILVGRDHEHKTQHVIATRDWHPAVTGHFAEEPDYNKTWPPHCVVGTTGAEFHPDLELKKHHQMVRIVSKGTAVDEDGYSGFDGRTDVGIPMRELLRPDPRRTALLIGGLATDYCVRATVLDARENGFDTFVIEDAVRGVAPETTAAAIEEMKAAGAVFVTSDEIVAGYEEVR